MADDGRRAGLGVADAVSLRSAVADAGLSDDQAAAVAQLCRAGAQVACLVGPAGAGKTRALRAAAAAWTATGHRVHGAAVSAMAASVLEAESGIASDTLVGFLRAVERGELVLDANDVVVVDEAGMVATAEFASLVGTVADAGAKVVFVGDDRHVAGEAMRALKRKISDAVYRQLLADAARR